MQESRALTTLRINVIILCVFALFYGFLKLADYMTAILMLFGGAFIFTYLFLGPVETVEGWLGRLFKKQDSKPVRVISVLVVYLVFFAFIGLFIYGFLPSLFTQVRSFANDLPGYLNRMEERLRVFQPKLQGEKTLMQKITDWTEAEKAKNSNAGNNNAPARRIDPDSSPQTIIVVVDDVKTAQKEIEKTVEKSRATLKGSAIGEATMVVKRYAFNVVDYLVGFGKNTLTTAIFILTGLVMVFYLLVDGAVLKEGFVHLLPSGWRRKTGDYLEHIHGILSYFIQGQVILALISGFGMWLVCVWTDVQYAFLLSLVFGMASIIPVIGPWFGIIPVVLVAVFAGGDLGLLPAWAAVLMYAGLFYLIKIYWLAPRWFENRLEIHPVVIILSFVACMKTANLMGILMAYPLASIIAGTYHYIIGQKQQTSA